MCREALQEELLNDRLTGSTGKIDAEVGERQGLPPDWLADSTDSISLLLLHRQATTNNSAAGGHCHRAR
jgi:hypothetical protein